MSECHLKITFVNKNEFCGYLYYTGSLLCVTAVICHFPLLLLHVFGLSGEVGCINIITGLTECGN